MARTPVDRLAFARVAAGLAGCGSVSLGDPDASRAPPDGGTDAVADAGVEPACRPGADPGFDEGGACARDAFCLAFSRRFLPIDLCDAEIDGAPSGPWILPREARARCPAHPHRASGIRDEAGDMCEDFPGRYR